MLAADENRGFGDQGNPLYLSTYSFLGESVRLDFDAAFDPRGVDRPGGRGYSARLGFGHWIDRLRASAPIV